MRKILFAIPLLVFAFPAAAQDRSRHLVPVLECRKLADAAERLACFDKAVAELDTAEREQRVVVVDKEQVQQARRSVFGLKLPKIRLFGNGNDELAEVEMTLTSVTRQRDGTLAFTVDDGARWVQTDDKMVVGVKAGGKVTLKRGALGSFFARFHGSTAARVQRVN
jgi:hypothetical protein